MIRRSILLPLVFAACAGAAPPSPGTDATATDLPGDATDDVVAEASRDAGAPDVAADVTADVVADVAADVAAPKDDDAGASASLTLDYAQVDCAAVEAVAFNDGGTRQNEVCDRGRTAAPRYATVRACAEALTRDEALVRRVADDGAYMNPTRHPGASGPPCGRFTVVYPVEQVQRALWCLRRPGACNDDGSAR